MLITMPKERIFLQSQEKKSSSDAKEDKMKHSGNPEVITQSEIVLSKGLASNADNHARKEKIFLQSQDRKHSSSVAKEDKMKHSGNPEVITQSEIVLSKGLASILTNLRETSIDTAKKENLHIILENVSEERNFEFSSRKICDVDNHARREKIFLQSQEEKIPHLMQEDKMKHSGNPEGMNTE
ncbi:hypothetical protein TNCT_727272 [Trichonephila clavata]|uniref:Uncharacterized protein n=1 Tax=Trichonephila clavata TaxID=2740835 RepID=A0A8X6FRZ4_TRICU|nr:hypothetical protein TNCT_727272 [Trichonephila clavata]